mgnify:CR=1 FL=1
MKNLDIIFLSLFLITAVIGCSKDNSGPDDGTDSTDTTVHEDSLDYLPGTSDNVYITFVNNTIKIDSGNVEVNGSSVFITQSGTYHLSGKLSDGQVIVNSPDENNIWLILDNVDITCNTSAPLFISDAKKVILVLAEGSSNYLKDGINYSTADSESDEPNAAVFSKSDLSVTGTGSLDISANYKDGISSKDGLVINSGTLIINAQDDGIRGKDYLIVNDGDISISSLGDGMSSDNEDNEALGYIDIKSGKFTISSLGDAIAATTGITIEDGEFSLTSGGGSNKTVSATSSAKAIKAGTRGIINNGFFSISSAEDGIHSDGTFEINGGNITISASDDGIHADESISISSGNLNIAKSFEGIESPLISVSDGYLNITATDDGFNASNGNGGEQNDGSNLNISGGNIMINASGGDGLDSNGNISMNSGTVIVHGPKSSPEVGLDYNGTFNISGGLLIISGTNSNMTQAPGAGSGQYSLKLFTTTVNPAGTIFHINDSNGNDILTFQPERSYYSIVFSSPLLKLGSTYSIYTGGSSTGINNGGLITDGYYTAGNLLTSFTITSKVTTIGSASGGGGGGGGGPRP